MDIRRSKPANNFMGNPRHTDEAPIRPKEVYLSAYCHVKATFSSLLLSALLIQFLELHNKLGRICVQLLSNY